MGAIDAILSIALALVMALVGYYVGSASKARQAATRAIQFLLPTLVLVPVFLIMRIAFVESISRKSFVVVEGKENCEDALVALVRSAKGYVYATGSVSRSGPYLEAIEDRLLHDENFQYKRVIWGQDYSEQFRAHFDRLKAIPAGMALLYYRLEPDVYFVVSDNEVFVKLPSMKRGMLDGGILTRNSDWVEKYTRYFIGVLARTPTDSTVSLFEDYLTVRVE